MAAIKFDASADTIVSLLSAEADPCIQDRFGGSAVHYAVGLGQSGIGAIDQLVHVRATLNAVDCRGVSPLGLAAMANNERLVKHLLVARAFPDDCRHLLPFMRTGANSNSECRGLLESAMKV